MNHQKSHEIFTAAQAMMPGGVNSPARAFGAVGGEPIVIASGSGAYLTDVDGNQYIDYIGSWGPMILGHAHPKVIGAIQQAVTRGTSFGAPTEAENVLASLVIDAVESIEKVRLVNSGTEATMSAIRVARGFTGRDLIVKFSGNYHGHVDSLLVAAGSAAATLSVPDSPGVTEGTTKDTIILSYNDIEQLKNAFEQHEGRIAAVIIEPVVGNMGCVIPSAEFLSSLRSITEQQGTLLIYDEVMTGFRVAYGGAQSLQQIRPDLTTLGKIVGGGLPLGAYGGRADVMNYVLPAGKVFQAGTLSGNPIATAAGIAILQQLRDEPPYEYLESISARLAEGLLAAAADAGLPHSFARVGSMMTLFFNPGPVSNWDTSSQSNLDRFARYFWGLANRGVYMPCSQFEALFISAAHTTEDIETTIQAARETLAEID
ncbi:MAG: glutamate-1-semialdehyde-2,1-aminomutase [Planctomycetaceae bacterium]|nr:glutamate-1-semialdehyde-2,1-aminomutase [Planctomycetaceae bacterium]